MLDGFDLLGATGRARLRARVGAVHGLVVTSHRVCAWPTLHRTRTTPALLARLTAELLGPAAAPRHAERAALHARCGGDLRQAFFALHAEAAADRLGRLRSRHDDSGEVLAFAREDAPCVVSRTDSSG